MTTLKKVALITSLVCLILCVALCAAGCKEEPVGTTTTATNPPVINTNYTISVRTAGGLLLDDVTVYVWETAAKDDLVDLPKKLDSEGKYTFEAPVGANYTVELKGVPVGYDVKSEYTLNGQTLDIVLNSAPIAGEAPAGTVYRPGDIIYDYVITTIDGVQYKISDILKEKNAVVLNFWYVTCGICIEEFPNLQDAYALHSDKVEVLALDVEDDSDASIRKMIEELGLTFPVAKVEGSMLSAMQANACPTTVVIDRYGMISFMYTGGLSDPAHFRALLRHFGSDSYEQQILDGTKEAIDALVQLEDIPYGCEEYPFDVGAVAEYQGQVRADELVYYMLYRIGNAKLRIEDPDVYLVWEGETYYPTDGVLEMTFPAPEDSFSGVKIALGTTGGVDKDVTLKQIPKEGTSENPYKLELGALTLTGDGIDRYYSFTAEATGTFTITIDSLPEGMLCRANMTNLRSYVTSDTSSEDAVDPVTGKITFTISVEAGDTVRIIFGTYGEFTETVQIQALASIPEVGGIGVSNEYTITVLDETGKTVENVSLVVNVNGVDMPCVTDANGEVKLELEAGTYFVTLILPEGYHATTQYLLTPNTKDLQIVLVPMKTYKLQVSITGEQVLNGVQVKIYSNAKLEELILAGTLDANGEMTFDYGYIDGFVAVLEGLPSSVFVQNHYDLTGAVTKIELVNTSIGDTNASNQHYQLGDKISEFSITTPDGRVYSIYEILKEKKAVLLTFWHSNDSDSLTGFRQMQSLYETYGTQLEILAMNPLDKSDMTISNYQGTNDFPFPMAQCSFQWESAFHLTAYPTMVMIDRDGTICLIQSGVVTDGELLELLFQRYTAEDYETTLLTDLQQLHAQENQPDGSLEKPYVVAADVTELTVTLEAGETAWFTFETLEPVIIVISGSENAYAVHGEETYTAIEGLVMLAINLEASEQQEMVQIGNSGAESITLVITLAPAAAG